MFTVDLDSIAGCVALVVAAAATAPCFYLLTMAPFAVVARGRGRALLREGASGHLAFVVPDHNEEADIEETLVDLVRGGGP